jgi:hypothetical protein
VLELGATPVAKALAKPKYHSTEQAVTLDVTVRVHGFGKPDVVEQEVRSRIERELGLMLGNAEIQSVKRPRRQPKLFDQDAAT